VLKSAGWLDLRDEHTYYYKPKKAEEVKEWPPKYWKFIFETTEEPKVEAAFFDIRRFSRIRFVNCVGADIRNATPLKENGPDPVLDKHILTVEWLTQKIKSKHVHVKTFLLDQANISGIGNLVG
jgi:formamidopyrimidine-DNA glycosylase